MKKCYNLLCSDRDESNQNNCRWGNHLVLKCMGCIEICPECEGSKKAFANDPPTGYQCETCTE